MRLGIFLCPSDHFSATCEYKKTAFFPTPFSEQLSRLTLSASVFDYEASGDRIPL